MSRIKIILILILIQLQLAECGDAQVDEFTKVAEELDGMVDCIWLSQRFTSISYIKYMIFEIIPNWHAYVQTYLYRCWSCVQYMLYIYIICRVEGNYDFKPPVAAWG